MAKLQLHYQEELIEAGCDEAGRGCLAGPVVAAAVILPKNFSHPFLNDSKKLNQKQREELRPIIEEQAVTWGVGQMSPEEIDTHNILKASFFSMHRGLDQLNPRPEFIVVDGNRFIPYQDIEHKCIVKGDSKYLNIAAASVLAKTYRDEVMQSLHAQYPEYQWNKNKGYPTKDHRSAIAQIGPSPFHRKTFKLLADQIEIPFNS